MVGTSMAAPMVTGTAGLLLALRPDMTPTQLRACLVAGATTDIIGVDVNELWVPDALDCAAGPTDTSRSVLVFGSGEFDAVGNTMRFLGDAGYGVAKSLGVPPRLDDFSAVFHIAAYEGLPTMDEDRLVDFVTAGKGVYLTGERPCCAALNATVRRIVDETVTDPGVEVLDADTFASTADVNPDVVFDVDGRPNAVASFNPSAPGVLSGVQADNVLATTEGQQIGAVWGEGELAGGQGRLAVVMDINWLQSAYGGSTACPLVENLGLFLTQLPSATSACNQAAAAERSSSAVDDRPQPSSPTAGPR